MSALRSMTKPRVRKTSTDTVQNFVEHLVAADRDLAYQDRRSEKRHPFAHPVTVRLGRDATNEIPAFSRDISPQGIGLLHRDKISAGRIGTLSIHLPNEKPVSVRAELRWSEPYGDGWFLTGWRLIMVQSDRSH